VDASGNLHPHAFIGIPELGASVAYVAVLEGLHLITGRETYARISAFWIKIFAVSFPMGVVTGIIMPFQFGTNWSRFTDATANMISPMMAYEGFLAFALEASFLGILLFGRTLVPRWAHFFAALMVSLGTLFSSFWILATNSWMQTPGGYAIINGRFFPTDWLAIVFSSSFPYRLLHNDTAFFVTTAFVMLGVGAFLVRRGDRRQEEARLMMRMAPNLLIVIVPLQIVLGDLHGRNTLAHQPAKLTAIEGLWQSAGPMREALFAIPDQGAHKKLRQDRYSASRQPDPDPQLERSGSRARGVAARSTAAGMAGVFLVSHYGRHSPADAGGRAGRMGTAIAREFVR
jgi:cytochrome bd ubiquinol oxidase subunit I